MELKQHAFMDNSEDISDKSPIFIVSGSQASDNKTAACTEISSTSNISQDQTEIGKENR